MTMIRSRKALALARVEPHVCPFLSLDGGDQYIDEPHEVNQCGAMSGALSVSHQHQAEFCLDDWTACNFYKGSMEAQQAIRAAQASPPTSQREPSVSERLDGLEATVSSLEQLVRHLHDHAHAQRHDPPEHHHLEGSP